MSSNNDPQDRDRWARLRFSIVGTLLAAPPEPGQLHAALLALSAKSWQHPNHAQPVQFGLSTIRRWYYLARRANDPVQVLRRQRRADAGAPSALLRPLAAAISAQYQAHSSWSFQLHYDNLRVATDAPQPFASYSTLWRYMTSQGMLKVPRARRPATPGALAAAQRLQTREVRSYEVEQVNLLWHLDVHHGSRKVITRQGSWATPMLLGILDDCSRLVAHAQWYLDETTESLVHGFSQALQKRGRPRAVMSDNGAAMIAEEFGQGLHALGILHQRTLPYSPHVNGKQENFWGRVEGRLLAMLEGVAELSLEYLNTATQAWVEQEYNRSVHGELGCSPLQRYLSATNVARECPGSEDLRRAFRIEVTRTQRRSDGTVRIEAVRFEIPSRYRHIQRVCLRYARWDLRTVDLIDQQSGTILCALYPLDKAANANAHRRALDALTPLPTPPAADGPAPLLKALMAEYSATGLPPAYIPTVTKEPE